MGRTKNLRQKIAEEIEAVDAVGQENEKQGIKAVQEVMKEKEKEEKQREDRILNVLNSRKSSIRSYSGLLRDLLDGLCHTVELPKGYDYRIKEDKNGIALIIKTPAGLFAKAFRPCGLEEYDLNAINTIVRDFEDTIDRVSGSQK